MYQCHCPRRMGQSPVDLGVGDSGTQNTAGTMSLKADTILRCGIEGTETQQDPVVESVGERQKEKWKPCLQAEQARKFQV